MNEISTLISLLCENGHMVNVQKEDGSFVLVEFLGGETWERKYMLIPSRSVKFGLVDFNIEDGQVIDAVTMFQKDWSKVKTIHIGVGDKLFNIKPVELWYELPLTDKGFSEEPST